MNRSICAVLFLGMSLTAHSQVIDQNRTQLSSKLYSDATLCLEAKNYAKAEELFSKAIAYYKENSDYFYGRGLANYYMDHLDLALDDIKMAIELDRGQASFYYYVGAILYQQNEYLKAKYHFEKALSLNDQSILKIDVLNCKFHIGVCLMKLEYYRAAASAFSNILSEDPFYEKALLNRGIALGTLHDFDQACDDFHRAAQLGNPRASEFIEKYCNSGKPVVSKN